MKNSSSIFTDVCPVTTVSNILKNQNDCVMTQKEVADIIGVSRIAIQQIETRAIKKFKRELRRRNINALDLI